jgi:predicted DNA-binding antitoxin AbrB/MazE fold protein
LSRIASWEEQTAEQIIKATYHEGVFHPTPPEEVTLHEGDTVELAIKKIDSETEAKKAARVERILNLLNHFYEDLNDSEINEIERAMRRRVNFAGPENKAQFD